MRYLRFDATAFVVDLERWFATEGRDFPWRHEVTSPWQLLVTETLLQQTRAARVSAILEPFFEVFPTHRHVLRAEERALAAVLRPLGLHRRRATTLLALAAEVHRRGGVPRRKTSLLSLPGVGPYVASAVRCVAWGAREATLDVNMARVIERAISGRDRADIRTDTRLDRASRRLVKAAADPRRFNWAMLDLGALVCRASRPRCPICPVRAHCRAYAGLGDGELEER